MSLDSVLAHLNGEFNSTYYDFEHAKHGFIAFVESSLDGISITHLLSTTIGDRMIFQILSISVFALCDRRPNSPIPIFVCNRPFP